MFANVLILSLIGFVGASLSYSESTKPDIKCPRCFRSFRRFDIKESRFVDKYCCPCCTHEFKNRY